MPRYYKIARILILFTFLIALQIKGYAQPLRVAVAANAQSVIKKLQADFKKRTGIELEVIIGASGKLTAQIMNGAPYEIFLSADTEFPDQLFAKGYGLKSPKVYALGSLIVCGSAKGEVKNWQSLLKSIQVKKIAIANPKTAPYGKAAQESLKFFGLENDIASKLVFGESISQVNTYIQTSAVEVGFTTEAFLYERVDHSKVKWVRVDPKSYGKIEQAAILLKYANQTNLDKATQFYNYLSSPSARKIIDANGYHLPLQN
ncbi:molybdate ABC transporter substrate-binding protein [Pedobacter agri]|uniref:molybdate ABC transporter substrate-binding protein n=1 Tax=Pedobacter agri TaxID=454586 RepID=UPI00278B997D|nr:molybdate ABC transporter substrate-binding protein [Pedobacter agri]MDQ1142492.1 molybdate transport system substrate-binding protein [Pedobacter agri]